MCRFALYMGPPIALELLTTIPEHSIVRQSFKSRMREEPLNGDGFGLAWYVPEISAEPALFRSVSPAWNNINLWHLARVSVSPVILAHVRAATEGFSVSETNCHPFTAGRYAFMHNGSVAGFKQIKRWMRSDLSDESYLWIHGSTDSEHLFARFRDHMRIRSHEEPAEAMANSIAATIQDVERMTSDIGEQRSSLLNIAVSDGQVSIVSRYATCGHAAPSLHYLAGGRYFCENGVCRMSESHRPDTIIVASEPLTAEAEWQAVPDNHLLVIRPNHHLELREIE